MRIYSVDVSQSPLNNAHATMLAAFHPCSNDQGTSAERHRNRERERDRNSNPTQSENRCTAYIRIRAYCFWISTILQFTIYKCIIMFIAAATTSAKLNASTCFCWRALEHMYMYICWVRAQDGKHARQLFYYFDSCALLAFNDDDDDDDKVVIFQRLARERYKTKI